MTADERESSILAMLEALRFARPRDMEELVAWVSTDDTGRGTCEPCPTFSEEL